MVFKSLPRHRRRRNQQQSRRANQCELRHGLVFLLSSEGRCQQLSAISAEMFTSRAAKIGMHFAGMTKSLVRSFNDRAIGRTRRRVRNQAAENQLSFCACRCCKILLWRRMTQSDDGIGNTFVSPSRLAASIPKSRRLDWLKLSRDRIGYLFDTGSAGSRNIRRSGRRSLANRTQPAFYRVPNRPSVIAPIAKGNLCNKTEMTADI